MHKYFAEEDILFHKKLGEVVVKDIRESSVNLRTMNGQEYIFQIHEFGKVLFLTKEFENKSEEQGVDYLEENKEKIKNLREERLKEIQKIKLIKEEKIFSEIEKYLEIAAFENAEETYHKNKEILSREKYFELYEKYKEVKEKKKRKKILEEKELKRLKALKEEEDKKTLEIKKYFAENFYDGEDSFLLDFEQASTINNLNSNILVAARAGSGKTRVIVALILYLLEKEKVSSDAIMVLAFNRKVPEEIKERINKKVVLKSNPNKYNKLDIVLTFHKFALDISKTNEKILASDRRNFIKEIIINMIETDEEFASRVYSFFRKESFELEKTDTKRNVSLKGEIVKSQSEKWIADFLFEHGIEYFYEYSFYPTYIKTTNIDGTDIFKKNCLNFINENENEVKPSFYLKNHRIVWEHWTDNKENIIWKRNFWKNWRNSRLIPMGHWAIESIKNVRGLIETSAEDTKDSREHFEKIIIDALEAQGINPEKREKEDLTKDITEKSINRFTNLVTSFIDRYQQNFFGSKESFIKLTKEYKSNPRVYEFLKLSLEVFDCYEQELDNIKSEYALDFNQLLRRAIDEINSGKADKEIKKIRYLLIDEYQDFSELFFRLIKAIRNRNPQVKLFCVGDDWQAINRFAGSDTKYFTEFNSYFPNSFKKEMGTNYRSVDEIIKKSNKFMKRHGFPGKESESTTSSDSPSIIKELINFIPIDEEKNEDQKFIQEFTDPRGEKVRDFTIKTKYLKKCFEIVKENPGKGILILHRYNNFRYDLALHSFREKLCKILVRKEIIKEEEIIKISTMHSSKGMEEDIVIILEANENILESVHPDNELFTIFGDTPSIAIEDQKRLFYVAITRAKEKVYLLYEKDKESKYLAGF